MRPPGHVLIISLLAMVISRERYLDDASKFHFTLALQSRTLEMHSLLTGLTQPEHQAIGDVLVRALDDISRMLQPKLERQPARNSP